MCLFNLQAQVLVLNGSQKGITGNEIKLFNKEPTAIFLNCVCSWLCPRFQLFCLTQQGLCVGGSQVYSQYCNLALIF